MNTITTVIEHGRKIETLLVLRRRTHWLSRLFRWLWLNATGASTTAQTPTLSSSVVLRARSQPLQHDYMLDDNFDDMSFGTSFRAVTGDSHKHSCGDINPATGLPMLDSCIDVACNPYGLNNSGTWSSHDWSSGMHNDW